MQLASTSVLFCLIFASAGKSRSLVRIDSGHQLIHVESRDPYEGYFTRLTFSRVRCITSLNVDCLVPLTGAEDIEIIYSLCENTGPWHLSHYSNSGGSFVLRSRVFARRIAVVSRKELSVINVSVHPCNDTRLSENLLKNISSCRTVDMHRSSHPLRHVHRHSQHRKEKFSVIEDVVRRKKRSLPIQQFNAENSPYVVYEDIFVPSGEILRIPAGVAISFADNVSIVAHGALQIDGVKHKSVSLGALTKAWRGVFIHANGAGDSVEPSRMRYVNVSGSTEGVVVEGPSFAEMDHVICDGNDKGITFRFNGNHTKNTSDSKIGTFSYRASKLIAINNRQNGFTLQFDSHPQGQILLDGAVSASNRGDGIAIFGPASLKVLSCQFFSNNNNGIFAALSRDSSLEITESLIGSNGNVGLLIMPSEQTRVKIVSSNFTAHYYGAAISVAMQNKMDFLMQKCHVWSNSAGGIYFINEIHRSDIRILNGNFTRNKGTVVFVAALGNDSNLQIQRNRFAYNQLLKSDVKSVLIEVRAATNSGNTRIQMNENNVLRNTMENILYIGGSEATKTVTGPRVTLFGNTLLGNLAIDVTYLAISNANVSYNRFENIQAQCELRTGIRVNGGSIFAQNNYWGTSDEKQILERVCDSGYDEVAMSAISTPFLLDSPFSDEETAQTWPISSTLTSSYTQM